MATDNMLPWLRFTIAGGKAEVEKPSSYVWSMDNGADNCLFVVALRDDLHDCVTEDGSQVFPAGDREEIPSPVIRLLVVSG